MRKCRYEPCGIEFLPYRPGQRFHSDECRNRFHAPRSNAQRRKRYANDPNYRQRHLAEATSYYKKNRDKVRAQNRTKQAERTEYARKWRKDNPERAQTLSDRGHAKLKLRLLPRDLPKKPKTWQQIVPVLVADHAAGGNISNHGVCGMFGLKVSKETMNDIRRYCHIPGPKGRPQKSL
jgi:hypothetical protein